MDSPDYKPRKDMDIKNAEAWVKLNEERIALLNKLESEDGVRDIMVSDCCGAIVYESTSICPVCQRKFEAISEQEFEDDYE
jgi:hypothetical protein